MGAQNGDCMANHHLIPEEIMKDARFKDLFDRLQNIGWDGDGALMVHSCQVLKIWLAQWGFLDIGQIMRSILMQ